MWVARYRTVLRQWSLVESEMAKTYDVTLSDLFRMSWRRFIVLFNSAVEWGDREGEDVPTGRGSGELARTVDWDQAVPKENIVEMFKSKTIPVSKAEHS